MTLPAGGYYRLAQAYSAELERKKSMFHTRVAPVQDRAGAEAVRAEMANLFPDCRHLCFAYVLGPPHQPQFTAAFDAGEPSGTAGRPMLNTLLSRQLGDVVAVVARYFGGIKLGAGGLARAYSAAVTEALEGAELVVCEPQVQLQLIVEYPLWERVQRAVGEYQGQVIAAEYGSAVVAQVAVPTRNMVELKGALGAIDHRLQPVVL